MFHQLEHVARTVLVDAFLSASVFRVLVLGFVFGTLLGLEVMNYVELPRLLSRWF